MSDINEFDAQSGEVVIRAYTKTELKQRVKDSSSDTPKEVVPNLESEALTSAINKLKTIGLTEEEAKAIAGI
jgi:hypothetical protein